MHAAAADTALVFVGCSAEQQALLHPAALRWARSNTGEVVSSDFTFHAADVDRSCALFISALDSGAVGGGAHSTVESLRAAQGLPVATYGRLFSMSSTTNGRHILLREMVALALSRRVQLVQRAVVQAAVGIARSTEGRQLDELLREAGAIDVDGHPGVLFFPQTLLQAGSLAPSVAVMRAVERKPTCPEETLEHMLHRAAKEAWAYLDLALAPQLGEQESPLNTLRALEVATFSAQLGPLSAAQWEWICTALKDVPEVKEFNATVEKDAGGAPVVGTLLKQVLVQADSSQPQPPAVPAGLFHKVVQAAAHMACALRIGTLAEPEGWLQGAPPVPGSPPPPSDGVEPAALSATEGAAWMSTVVKFIYAQLPTLHIWRAARGFPVAVGAQAEMATITLLNCAFAEDTPLAIRVASAADEELWHLGAGQIPRIDYIDSKHWWQRILPRDLQDLFGADVAPESAADSAGFDLGCSGLNGLELVMYTLQEKLGLRLHADSSWEADAVAGMGHAAASQALAAAQPDLGSELIDTVVSVHGQPGMQKAPMPASVSVSFRWADMHPLPLPSLQRIAVTLPALSEWSGDEGSSAPVSHSELADIMRSNQLASHHLLHGLSLQALAGGSGDRELAALLRKTAQQSMALTTVDGSLYHMKLFGLGPVVLPSQSVRSAASVLQLTEHAFGRAAAFANVAALDSLPAKHAITLQHTQLLTSHCNPTMGEHLASLIDPSACSAAARREAILPKAYVLSCAPAGDREHMLSQVLKIAHATATSTFPESCVPYAAAVPAGDALVQARLAAPPSPWTSRQENASLYKFATLYGNRCAFPLSAAVPGIVPGSSDAWAHPGQIGHTTLMKHALALQQLPSMLPFLQPGETVGTALDFCYSNVVGRVRVELSTPTSVRLANQLQLAQRRLVDELGQSACILPEEYRDASAQGPVASLCADPTNGYLFGGVSSRPNPRPSAEYVVPEVHLQPRFRGIGGENRSWTVDNLRDFTPQCCLVAADSTPFLPLLGMASDLHAAQYQWKDAMRFALSAVRQVPNTIKHAAIYASAVLNVGDLIVASEGRHFTEHGLRRTLVKHPRWAAPRAPHKEASTPAPQAVGQKIALLLELAAGPVEDTMKHLQQASGRSTAAFKHALEHWRITTSPDGVLHCTDELLELDRPGFEAGYVSSVASLAAVKPFLDSVLDKAAHVLGSTDADSNPNAMAKAVSFVVEAMGEPYPVHLGFSALQAALTEVGCPGARAAFACPPALLACGSKCTIKSQLNTVNGRLSLACDTVLDAVVLFGARPTLAKRQADATKEAAESTKELAEMTFKQLAVTRANQGGESQWTDVGVAAAHAVRTAARYLQHEYSEHEKLHFSASVKGAQGQLSELASHDALQCYLHAYEVLLSSGESPTSPLVASALLRLAKVVPASFSTDAAYFKVMATLDALHAARGAFGRLSPQTLPALTLCVQVLAELVSPDCSADLAPHAWEQLRIKLAKGPLAGQQGHTSGQDAVRAVAQSMLQWAEQIESMLPSVDAAREAAAEAAAGPSKARDMLQAAGMSAADARSALQSGQYQELLTSAKAAVAKISPTDSLPGAKQAAGVAAAGKIASGAGEALGSASTALPLQVTSVPTDCFALPTVEWKGSEVNVARCELPHALPATVHAVSDVNAAEIASALSSAVLDLSWQRGHSTVLSSQLAQAKATLSTDVGAGLAAATRALTLECKEQFQSSSDELLTAALAEVLKAPGQPEVAAAALGKYTHKNFPTLLHRFYSWTELSKGKGDSADAVAERAEVLRAMEFLETKYQPGAGTSLLPFNVDGLFAEPGDLNRMQAYTLQSRYSPLHAFTVHHLGGLGAATAHLTLARSVARAAFSEMEQQADLWKAVDSVLSVLQQDAFQHLSEGGDASTPLPQEQLLAIRAQLQHEVVQQATGQLHKQDTMWQLVSTLACAAQAFLADGRSREPTCVGTPPVLAQCLAQLAATTAARCFSSHCVKPTAEEETAIPRFLPRQQGVDTGSAQSPPSRASYFLAAVQARAACTGRHFEQALLSISGNPHVLPTSAGAESGTLAIKLMQQPLVAAANLFSIGLLQRAGRNEGQYELAKAHDSLNAARECGMGGTAARESTQLFSAGVGILSLLLPALVVEAADPISGCQGPLVADQEVDQLLKEAAAAEQSTCRTMPGADEAWGEAPTALADLRSGLQQLPQASHALFQSETPASTFLATHLCYGVFVELQSFNSLAGARALSCGGGQSGLMELFQLTAQPSTAEDSWNTTLSSAIAPDPSQPGCVVLHSVASALQQVASLGSGSAGALLELVCLAQSACTLSLQVQRTFQRLDWVPTSVQALLARSLGFTSVLHGGICSGAAPTVRSLLRTVYKCCQLPFLSSQEAPQDTYPQAIQRLDSASAQEIALVLRDSLAVGFGVQPSSEALRQAATGHIVEMAFDDFHGSGVDVGVTITTDKVIVTTKLLELPTTPARAAMLAEVLSACAQPPQTISVVMGDSVMLALKTSSWVANESISSIGRMMSDVALRTRIVRLIAAHAATAPGIVDEATGGASANASGSAKTMMKVAAETLRAVSSGRCALALYLCDPLSGQTLDADLHEHAAGSLGSRFKRSERAVLAENVNDALRQLCSSTKSISLMRTGGADGWEVQLPMPGAPAQANIMCRYLLDDGVPMCDINAVLVPTVAVLCGPHEDAHRYQKLWNALLTSDTLKTLVDDDGVIFSMRELRPGLRGILLSYSCLLPQTQSSVQAIARLCQSFHAAIVDCLHRFFSIPPTNPATDHTPDCIQAIPNSKDGILAVLPQVDRTEATPAGPPAQALGSSASTDTAVDWLAATHKAWVLVRALNFLKADSPGRSSLRGAAASLNTPLPAAIAPFKLPLSRLFDAMKPLLDTSAVKHRAFVSCALVERIFVAGEVMGVPEWCAWALSCVAAGIAACDSPKPLSQEATQWVREHAAAASEDADLSMLAFVSDTADSHVRSLGLSDGHSAQLAALAEAQTAEGVHDWFKMRADELRSTAERCLGKPWLEWVAAAVHEYHATARLLTSDPTASLGERASDAAASTSAPLATLLLPEVLHALCAVLTSHSEALAAARSFAAFGDCGIETVIMAACAMPFGAAGVINHVPSITRSQAYSRCGLEIPDRTGGEPSDMEQLLLGGHDFEPTQMYNVLIGMLADNPAVRIIGAEWLSATTGDVVAATGARESVQALLKQDSISCMDIRGYSSAASLSAMAAIRNLLASELVDPSLHTTAQGSLRYVYRSTLRACMLAETINTLTILSQSPEALQGFAAEHLGHLGPSSVAAAQQLVTAGVGVWSSPVSPVHTLYCPALSLADLAMWVWTYGPIMQHVAQPTPGVTSAFSTAWCGEPHSQLHDKEQSRLNAELHCPSSLRAAYVSALAVICASDQFQSLGTPLPHLLLTWGAAEKGVMPAIHAPAKANANQLIQTGKGAIEAAEFVQKRSNVLNPLSLVTAVDLRGWHNVLVQQDSNDHGRWATSIVQCMLAGDVGTAEDLLASSEAAALFGSQAMLLASFRAAQGASETSSRDVAAMPTAVAASLQYLRTGQLLDGVTAPTASALADMTNSMTLALSMCSLITVSGAPALQAAVGGGSVSRDIVHLAQQVWSSFSRTALSQAGGAADLNAQGALDEWAQLAKITVPSDAHIRGIDMNAQRNTQPGDREFINKQLTDAVCGMHAAGIDAVRAIFDTVTAVCTPSTGTGLSCEYEASLSMVAESAHNLAFLAPFSKGVLAEWFQGHWCKRALRLAGQCSAGVFDAISMGPTRSLSTIFHGFDAPGAGSQVPWAVDLAASTGGQASPEPSHSHDHDHEHSDECSHSESGGFAWLSDALREHSVDRIAERRAIAQEVVRQWSARVRFQGWHPVQGDQQLSYSSSLLFAPCSDAMLHASVAHVLDAGGLGPLLQSMFAPTCRREPLLLALATLLPYLATAPADSCPVLDTHSYTSAHGDSILLFSTHCLAAPSEEEKAAGGVLVSRAQALALSHMVLFPIACSVVQSSASASLVAQAAVILAALAAPAVPAPLQHVLQRVEFTAAHLQDLPSRLHELVDDRAGSQGLLASLIAAAQAGTTPLVPVELAHTLKSSFMWSLQHLEAWTADAATPAGAGPWLRPGQPKPSDGDALQWLPPPPANMFSAEACSWVWQHGVRAERAVVALPFGAAQAASFESTFLALEAYFPLASARLALHPLFVDSMYTAGTVGSLLQIAESVGSALRVDARGVASDLSNRLVALGWLDTLCNRAVLAGQSISLLAHSSGPEAAQAFLESAQAAAQAESEGVIGEGGPRGGLPILVQALDPILHAAQSASTQPRPGGWRALA